jgi:hypothetical protein
MLEGFTDGQNVIAANPHRCFEKIRLQGYEIFYKEAADELTLQVLHSGQIVAGARFSNGVTAYPVQTDVGSQHLRRGLGNAMYVFAEKFLGRVLDNYLEGTSLQSESAKRLWEQPDRQFGNKGE